MLLIIALLVIAFVALTVLGFALHLLLSPWLLVVAIGILAWIKFRLAAPTGRQMSAFPAGVDGDWQPVSLTSPRLGDVGLTGRTHCVQTARNLTSRRRR